MAEVINTNVFDANKKFVDFAGLDYFWEKAKSHIDDADKALSDKLGTAESEIDALQGAVGDENSGLVKDVAQLRTEVDALGGAEGGIQGMIDNTVAGLDVEDTAVSGQYVSSVAEIDGKVVVNRADLPDWTDEISTAKDEAIAAAKEETDAQVATNKGLIDGLAGRVGTLEGISHAAEIKYENGYIKLYDAENNVIGEGFDASEFVVDGMLDSVDFEKVDGVATNNLVFTFNTASGKEEVKVDFGKYVDVYQADGTSIELTDKTFSVKEVAANKTKLGQKITIAGGPLANNIAESGETWPAQWTDQTTKEKFIPENATMYDIVMNLFCVEKWPTNVTTSDATLVSTVSTPSLTYNGKSANNNSTTVEVGSTVSYEAKSGASSFTATPATASGFTYGYADANDGHKDSSDTSKSATFNDADGNTTVAAVGNSVPTLTLSGKVSETVNGTAGSASTGAATKSGNVVIALGDNKIKAQSKSITYTGTCTALPTYYGCSNLGNTDNNGTTYASTAKDSVTLTSSAVNSGTIEINCVGAYKVFVGYVADVPTTSAGVRAMNANNRLGKGACGTSGTEYTINNNYMVVAVPTGWNFTIQNDLGQADQRNSFKKSTNTVAVELPNHTEEVPSTVAYDIWSIGWSGGKYKNLVIV